MMKNGSVLAKKVKNRNSQIAIEYSEKDLHKLTKFIQDHNIIY